MTTEQKDETLWTPYIRDLAKDVNHSKVAGEDRPEYGDLSDADLNTLFDGL